MRSNVLKVQAEVDVIAIKKDHGHILRKFQILPEPNLKRLFGFFAYLLIRGLF